ncbi:YggS family pyridoxal phosphate-dependent enzyme [Algimonas porphyrae]|uniref:Pyridoxal phosphate homeostasis protein n=1 Tax=Algimonas porphyrae TaxID=1128113 RepID=A0ABQ5V170_9PROT|nr:YggS family pyridoxal phosphate-dependent enzyme [Algimonas porphyrae]GLQ20543.1 YggS family pyridoxal phosphate enzyme [Algimonas porphyrae]
MTPTPSIDEPIDQVRTDILARIDRAATRAGVPTPQLTAVSKMQPDDRVAAALAAGQTVFGENRVQEAQTRWGKTFAPARDGLELHLIGPLQTNKAKDAVTLFDVIQTLDREKLARALLKAADTVGHMPRLMVQVNIGEEDQKAGVMPDDLDSFLDRLRSEYGIEPDGLMCIPPLGAPVAPHFWRLEQMARRHGLAQLSMGMSADYETAIPFGATHVRVGSALFGARKTG